MFWHYIKISLSLVVLLTRLRHGEIEGLSGKKVETAALAWFNRKQRGNVERQHQRRQNLLLPGKFGEIGP